MSSAREMRSDGARLLWGPGVSLLLGLGSLVADLRQREVALAELRVVAEIAATAGARFLDGTPTGARRAELAARRAAARNTAGGQPVVLGVEDVRTGTWVEIDGTLVDTSDASRIDAVRVVARFGANTSSCTAVAAVGAPLTLAD